MIVAAVRTPIATPALLRALAVAHWKLFDVAPTKAANTLAGSMWAHETGRGDSCFNWNLGNAKATSRWEGDACERYCTELLTPEKAKAAIALAGQRLDGHGPDAAIVGQKGGKLIVGFWPSNPAARFRAFSSLEVGAVDWLDLLHNRFAPAWPELLAGDGQRLADVLFEQNYFNDDPAIYGAGLVSLQRAFSKHPVDLGAPPRDLLGALPSAQAASLQRLSWDLLKEATR